MTVNDEELAREIGSVCREHIRPCSSAASLLMSLKTSAFSVATTHPVIYGLGYPLISRFKERKPAADFSVQMMTDFQAALGTLLVSRIREMNIQRHEHGEYLQQQLAGRDDLLLAHTTQQSITVFNRFPVLFKDAQRVEEVRKRLWDAGIESSRMYERPLHHMFALGYAQDEFHNAGYCAGHLLTLPVHPGVDRSDLDRMVEIVTDDSAT